MNSVHQTQVDDNATFHVVGGGEESMTTTSNCYRPVAASRKTQRLDGQGDLIGGLRS